MVRRRRGRRSRAGRTRTIGLGGLAVVLLVALAVLAGVWWLYSRGLPWLPDDLRQRADEGSAQHGAPASAPPSTGSPAAAPDPDRRYPTEPELPVEPSAGPALPPPAPPRPAPAGGAYLALVVDDLGRSVEDVDRLAALGVPLSYAVLPFESRTPEVVAALARHDAEVLLHLPMEGRNGADPGPGALTLGMGRRRMLAATREALAAVPGAAGVNNHMGSVLSAHASSMRLVLGELAARGLFFVDSRTTADTVGYAAARQLGMPAAQRDVFLDPDLDPEAIRGQFHRLLEVAHREGSAVAIAHPHPVTLRVLEEEIPAALDLGYRFVPVSLLLDREVLPR